MGRMAEHQPHQHWRLTRDHVESILSSDSGSGDVLLRLMQAPGNWEMIDVAMRSTVEVVAEIDPRSSTSDVAATDSTDR